MYPEGESLEEKSDSPLEIYFNGVCPHKSNRFDNYFSPGCSCFPCWSNLYDHHNRFIYSKFISTLNKYKVKINPYNSDNSFGSAKLNGQQTPILDNNYRSFVNLLYNNSTGYLDPYI